MPSRFQLYHLRERSLLPCTGSRGTIDPTGLFERAIARLLLAAYNRIAGTDHKSVAEIKD